jgi:hypothetical protein
MQASTAMGKFSELATLNTDDQHNSKSVHPKESFFRISSIKTFRIKILRSFTTFKSCSKIF